MAKKQDIPIGTLITIEGHEKNYKGERIINGVNLRTNRKCKPYGYYQYKVTEVI